MHHNWQESSSITISSEPPLYGIRFRFIPVSINRKYPFTRFIQIRNQNWIRFQHWHFPCSVSLSINNKKRKRTNESIHSLRHVRTILVPNSIFNQQKPSSAVLMDYVLANGIFMCVISVSTQKKSILFSRTSLPRAFHGHISRTLESVGLLRIEAIALNLATLANTRIGSSRNGNIWRLRRRYWIYYPLLLYYYPLRPYWMRICVLFLVFVFVLAKLPLLALRHFEFDLFIQSIFICLLIPANRSLPSIK